MKNFALIVLMIGLSCSVRAQGDTEFGVGAAGIYNFQTEGWGAELRAEYLINNRFAIVPEVSYFFPFNPIHELYAGIGLHYEFNFFYSWHPYLSINAYYNNWVNASDYTLGQKKPNNITPEAGIGIVRARGCFRPFIENRYDTKWKEGSLRIGVLWFFNSCGKQKDCPAYSSGD